MKQQWSLILTPRQAEFWEQYCAAESTQQSVIARQSVHDFVAAIQKASPAVRDHFAEAVCRSSVEGEITFVLRQPLFQQVIFPFLIRAYQEGIAAAPFWIICFRHELSLMPSAMRENVKNEIPLFDGLALLREGLFRNPRNPALTQIAAAQLLKQADIDFSYAVHEVPAGILAGAKGASVAECQELTDDLTIYRQLAEQWNLLEKYQARFQFWEYHFRGCTDYLENRPLYHDYADYLAQHPFQEDV